MQVKLMSLTKPTLKKENGECMSAEEFIAYVARVSNPKNQHNHDTGHKLLQYCITHGHWSIFEHVSLTFEIKTSRAIAAQLLRHRSFTFQEFSQRYSTVTSFEDIEWRLQGKTNRQVGETAVDIPSDLKKEVGTLLDTCKTLYNKLIDQGIARECVRMILPLCTTTTLYMTGTLRSWIHYLKLRVSQDTQQEHSIIAKEIMEILRQEFPIVFLAMNKDEVYN